MPTPTLSGPGTIRRAARVPFWLCLVLPALPGCASVPKETVELSTAVGDDIRELHAGYRNTVGLYFAQLRQSGLTVIDETWVPAYLDSFVEGGGLRDIVADGNRDDLHAWAGAAIEDIDARRSKFVDSLNARETALLARIDEAFSRTLNANANVTAYLKSLLEVDEMQDRVLQATGLKELRDQITEGLAEASRFAAEATRTNADPPERED